MVKTFEELVEIAEMAKVKRLDKSDYLHFNKKLRIKTMINRSKGKGNVRGILYKLPVLPLIFYKYSVHSRYNKIRSNSDMLINDFNACKEEYYQCFQLFSDTKSKETFLNILAGEMLLDSRYGIQLATQSIGYDVKLLESERESFIKAGEIFVDCGAFTGDTLIELISERKIPKKYFAFEPDYQNYKKCKKVFSGSSIQEGNVYNVGCYNISGKLKFSGGEASGSKISEKGKFTIDVVKIDDVIKEPITTIKMDVEGSEYYALNGCAQLIKEYKPKLAISVYHLPTDYRKIPLLIKELNPNYSQFYIRWLGDTYSELFGFNEVVLFVK
ncbi:MAG: FkbM family methyltransferase [Lachnospiraceae bacterium]|nr:FkbM family methyltransferase [Lachnospiraceae bacterium]